MSTAAPQVDLSSLDATAPDYQEKLDAALFHAVNIADLAKIVESIKLGANPTSQQKKGRTGTTHALLVAVQGISDDGASNNLVPALLAANNINLDAADNQGNTALHVAAQRSQLAIVEALLARGASPMVKNLQENTPLSQSVSRPSATSESERVVARKVVEKLLAAVGEEVLSAGLPANKQLDSVLVKAVHQGNMEGTKAIIEYMAALLDKGTIKTFDELKAILGRPNNRGLGPLHEACVWANVDMITYLLDLQVPIEGDKDENKKKHLFDICDVDAQGNTVIHLAGDRRLAGISTGTLEHVRLLLARENCPINVQNKAGDTALHIPHISVEFLDLLLENKADVTLRNNAGSSALAVQIAGGRSHVVEQLLRHMFTTLKLNLKDYEKELLESRAPKGYTVAHMLAEINSDLFSLLPSSLHSVPASETEETPLEIAISEKSLTVLHELMNTATAEDFQKIRDFRDSQGNSLLHHAANMNDILVINSLLDKAKMNVNTPNEEMDEFTDGGLPIHLAAQSGCLEALNLLIERKSDIDSQLNPSQDTPLHLAVRFNHYEAVKSLVDAGASRSINNRDGVSPMLEIRSLRGHDERIRQIILPSEIR